MSRVFFRGSSPNGAEKHELHVTEVKNDTVCLEIRTQAGKPLGSVHLSLDMTDALGVHLQYRVSDMRDELEVHAEALQVNVEDVQDGLLEAISRRQQERGGEV